MQDTTRPWGQAAALLAACLATLVGVACGNDPDLVLLRAAVAGAVVGALVATLNVASRLMTDS